MICDGDILSSHSYLLAILAFLYLITLTTFFLLTTYFLSTYSFLRSLCGYESLILALEYNDFISILITVTIRVINQIKLIFILNMHLADR